MDNIPDEIMIIIFSYLSEEDLLNALKVSRRWYKIYRDVYQYKEDNDIFNKNLSIDSQLEKLCRNNKLITLKKFVILDRVSLLRKCPVSYNMNLILDNFPLITNRVNYKCIHYSYETSRQTKPNQYEKH